MGLTIRPRIFFEDRSLDGTALVERHADPVAANREHADSAELTPTQILYLRTTHVQQGVLQLHKAR